MLRIQRKYLGARRVVLELQGHLDAEWADLLERESAALGRPGVPVTLDLSGIVRIGRSGFEALSRLSRAGVGIVGCSPLVADALEHEGIPAERNPLGDDTGRIGTKRNLANGPGSSSR